MANFGSSGEAIMKKVLLRGPILSRSGYGEHARQVYSYLETRDDIDLKVQVLPWGITPWYLNADDLDGMIGRILAKSTNIQNPSGFDVSIQVQLPNEWDTTIAEKNIGVTAAIETTFANPAWVSPHCEKMNLVIVPSEHAKESLVNAGTSSTPIEVVHECYYEELTKEGSSIDLGLETDFNFLTIGVLTGLTPATDRKNLFFLLKWFVEEFKDDKDVGLIVKTNRGRETSVDRKGTKFLLEKILRELNHKGTPKIYLLHGPMSRTEMNSLYKDEKVKAFVSTTRGEGFGLPHLESAASGLPIIATNWSAHKEFLDLGKWLKLDYDLVEVPSEKIDNQVFLPGMKWAQVKEENFKDTIRKFYQKPDLPKKWAKDLSQKLLKEYSLDSAKEKYAALIGEFLL